MKVLALLASGAAVLPAVLAHGYISDPAAQWVDGYATNGYGSTVDNEIWGVYDNSVYGYGVAATVAFFEDEFPNSGYESLGQFIIANQVLYSDSVDEQCGMTVYDASARSTLPATNLTYTGFTHQGPCEVWCDDTKVLFEYDCSATYPDIPAGMPYDESLCADANRLTIYWLALHGDPWQVYIDCVWLDNGGSGSGSAPAPVTAAADAATTSSSSTASTTTTTTTSTASSSTGSTASEATTTTAPTTTTATPTTTTAAPTATTATPTTTTATTTTTTSAPASTTATTTTTTTTAPASTTATPSTTEKCTASTRRRHRN